MQPIITILKKNKSISQLYETLFLHLCFGIAAGRCYPMQAQTKAKAKSTTQTKAKSQTKTKTSTTKSSTAKVSSSKILYVEPEDRNYAQNLGGHMFWDYTAREGNGLRTDFSMEIAKKARKGLPFDTIPVDKKWPQYNKVLDKIKAAITSLYNMNTDIVLYNEAADYDRGSWLLENRPAIQREVA